MSPDTGCGEYKPAKWEKKQGDNEDAELEMSISSSRFE